MSGQLSVFSEVPLEEDLKQSLERRLRNAASLASQDFSAYFDRAMRDSVLGGLALTSADEGTIWLIDPDGEFLLPVFNSGPNAEEIVGKYRQSLRAGMISMVVATEHPIYENDVHWNEHQDRTLDGRLGVQTCAMIAVPFYFAGELRGVISGVQLRSPERAKHEHQGFAWADLQTLVRTATLLGRLIEHRLFLRLLGTEGWA